MLGRYKFSINETDYFNLEVHENVDKMRDAVKSYYENTYEPSGDYLGIVCPVRVVEHGADLDVKDGLFANVFLNKDNLGTGLLSHEALHIALAHHRHVGKSMFLGYEVDDNEKDLCYKIGQIMVDIVNMLYKEGYIG